MIYIICVSVSVCVCVCVYVRACMRVRMSVLINSSTTLPLHTTNRELQDGVLHQRHFQLRHKEAIQVEDNNVNNIWASQISSSKC